MMAFFTAALFIGAASLALTTITHMLAEYHERIAAALLFEPMPMRASND